MSATNDTSQAALRLLVRAIEDGDVDTPRGRRVLARARAAVTVRGERPPSRPALLAELRREGRYRRLLSLPNVWRP